MPNIGMTELIVVLAIAMLIFGPKQIPRLGRALGDTFKSFRGARKELDEMHRDGISDD